MTPSPSVERPRWEYQDLVIARPAINAKSLNELGAEGWEAYAIHTYGSVTTYFLKRELH